MGGHAKYYGIAVQSGGKEAKVAEIWLLKTKASKKVLELDHTTTLDR